MSRDLVNAICAALPGATHPDPWGGGHDCWKVGNKLFAVIGAVNQVVAVKTDGIDMAEMLIESGTARRAAYFHRSWIELQLDAAPDELKHRIESSYLIIRKGLPKKTQAALQDI